MDVGGREKQHVCECGCVTFIGHTSRRSGYVVEQRSNQRWKEGIDTIGFSRSLLN